MNNIETFDYHINWKTKGHHPGQHKSDQRGMGIEFAGHSNLIDYPDPTEKKFEAFKMKFIDINNELIKNCTKIYIFHYMKKS